MKMVRKTVKAAAVHPITDEKLRSCMMIASSIKDAYGCHNNFETGTSTVQLYNDNKTTCRGETSR